MLMFVDCIRLIKLYKEGGVSVHWLPKKKFAKTKSFPKTEKVRKKSRKLISSNAPGEKPTRCRNAPSMQMCEAAYTSALEVARATERERGTHLKVSTQSGRYDLWLVLSAILLPQKSSVKMLRRLEPGRTSGLFTMAQTSSCTNSPHSALE